MHAFDIAQGACVNDIVPPVYAALALVFLGLFAASALQRASAQRAHARSLRLAGAAALFAALACLCVALLPWVGRFALVLATTLMLGSYAAMYLRIRSWHRPVGNAWIAWTTLAVVLLCVLNGLLVAMHVPIPVRVVYQCVLANGLLAMALYELQRAPSEVGGTQLQILRWSLLAMMVFLTVWGWVVYQQQTYRGVVVFQMNLSEPWLAFVLRLFVTACLLLAHISSNAYALEQMTSLRMKTLSQLTQVEEENQYLEQILKEKSDMLRTASFAVRSQNLPAIVSSLSHEINQPLGAIRLNADYLMADIDHMAPAERQHVLAQLVKCSESISGVLVSFRRFFEVPVELHPIEMNSLLTDLTRGLRTEFLHKAVHVAYEPGAPVHVHGDAVQMESAVTGVIEHLLSLPAPGVTRLRIECSQVNSFAVVSVLCVESSISNDELQNTFDTSTKDNSGSFRSGLWLSRAIVEHHGGAMSVCVTDGFWGISLQLPCLKDMNS